MEWGEAAYNAYNRMLTSGEALRGLAPVERPAWADLKAGAQNAWNAAAQAAVGEYGTQRKAEDEQYRSMGLVTECSTCGTLVERHRAE